MKAHVTLQLFSCRLFWKILKTERNRFTNILERFFHGFALGITSFENGTCDPISTALVFVKNNRKLMDAFIDRFRHRKGERRAV